MGWTLDRLNKVPRNFGHVTPVPSPFEPLSEFAPLRQTGKTMETKRSLWKGVGKGEKLSIVLLAFCIVTLVTVLFLRLF